jgi:hypothetical protein
VQRDQFVEQLANHSEAGRLHEQDATFPKVKDPEAMLSLPEFMSEPIPQHLRYSDPTAMLTLPEFVREPPPEIFLPQEAPPEIEVKKPTTKLRSRSSSAPSLSWLFSHSGRMSPHRRSRSRNVVAEPVPPLPISKLLYTFSHFLTYCDFQMRLKYSTLQRITKTYNISLYSSESQGIFLVSILRQKWSRLTMPYPKII